jgi:hypothetical protein
MTEVEWLRASDLHEVLAFLDGKASDRKMRLFAVACCRRIWPYFPSDFSRRAVEIVEQAAEDLVAENEVLGVLRAARLYTDSSEAQSSEVGCSAAFAAASLAGAYSAEKQIWRATRVADCARDTLHWAEHEAAVQQGCDQAQALTRAEMREAVEAKAQAALLQDIVPNPFRPISIDPGWLTLDVRALARGIYDDRAFDRLPILADALIDAGCDNAEILDHCRSSGPHVRGCWVVDLLTGRT